MGDLRPKTVSVRRQLSTDDAEDLNFSAKSSIGKLKDRNVRSRVLEMLNDGNTRTNKEIMAGADVRSRRAVDGLLHKLAREGYVERVNRGIYRRARVVPDRYGMTDAG